MARAKRETENATEKENGTEKEAAVSLYAVHKDV
jgi:hypothetical protein